jgi:hypothetical protein
LPPSLSSNLSLTRASHILNVTTECPNEFQETEDLRINYFRVPVVDAETENLIPHFESAIEFLGKFFFFAPHVTNLKHRFRNFRGRQSPRSLPEGSLQEPNLRDGLLDEEAGIRLRPGFRNRVAGSIRGEAKSRYFFLFFFGIRNFLDFWNFSGFLRRQACFFFFFCPITRARLREATPKFIKCQILNNKFHLWINFRNKKL